MSSLRALSISDLEDVVRLTRQSEWGESWSKEKLEVELRQALSLAFFSPALVSFVIYRQMGDIIDVTWLATHKDFRGQGYMRTLFEQIFVAHSHVAELWLEVHENNKEALAFYAKMGFQIQGRRLAYYANGMAALNMSKKIT